MLIPWPGPLACRSCGGWASSSGPTASAPLPRRSQTAWRWGALPGPPACLPLTRPTASSASLAPPLVLPSPAAPLACWRQTRLSAPCARRSKPPASRTPEGLPKSGCRACREAAAGRRAHACSPLTLPARAHTHHAAPSSSLPQEYMRKYGDPAKVEAVLERVRMELAVYEASPTGARQALHGPGPRRGACMRAGDSPAPARPRANARGMHARGGDRPCPAGAAGAGLPAAVAALAFALATLGPGLPARRSHPAAPRAGRAAAAAVQAGQQGEARVPARAR